MATAATVQDPSQIQQKLSTETGAPQGQSSDPTEDDPQELTGEQVAAKLKLDQECQASLIELRRTFKMRYQPKRMRFVSEVMRAFEALRGNTYALLNDQAAALDTINQLMQGFLGQGYDPQLYAHNDNIYQAFCMIFIAALMVDLGKVRYQPADAQDDADLEIAKKASTIQAYNERKNDIASLQQLELLYLWLAGSYFTYVRYVVDKRKAGSSTQDIVKVVPKKIMPDGFICPKCGTETPDSKTQLFSNTDQCPKCGTGLSQKDWFEGPTLPVPSVVGQEEVANGMTAFDVVCGLMIDANPDAMKLEDTEILDYTVDTAVSKVRSAYPAMYAQITSAMGNDASSDGDMAQIARSGMTTPGSNNKPITTMGLVSYSRCWITAEAFNELENEEIAKELKKRFPDGCKLVMCGDETFLDAKNEALLDHWTWCGTIKGCGLYPFAAGKVVMDIQERVTGAVNKIDAYMDRVAFGTMLFDADYIDGNAMANKVLTPGNLTGVSRTDEESGQRVPLGDLFHQMTFQIDSEIYKYPDALTTRAQFLAGVMPQVFGGSDAHVETAAGQEQALNTALGRLKQYINQMRSEKAIRARISVNCSIENMDEEIKIVEENETGDSWNTIKMLKAELTGDFFTFPETDEGFPATFTEIQQRMMTLLADNQKLPFVSALLSDPDVGAVVAHYLLPDQIELPDEAQRAKLKTILHELLQDPNGPSVLPNPANPQGPPITVPSIMPEPNVDDPGLCVVLAKKCLFKNWQQKETNPKGYANVLAFLTVSSQMQKEAAAQQAITMQQQAQQQGGKGPAPGGS
jgi:predicted RNA-binding Zn-ribbon protein involved in translation (DUF1610 family)